MPCGLIELWEHQSRRETLALVSDLLEQLGEDQRACLTWRFLHGKSIAETAAVMSRSQGAVKLLQYRAIRCLRDRLESHTWKDTA